MSYRSTAPRLGDTDNVLLFKIAQSLNAGAAQGDTANDLLRKIAAAAAAATGGTGDGTFANVTATNGTFTNLTAVNGNITNLTAPNLNSTTATISSLLATIASGNLLRFGGSTAAFPALKNTGAELQVRLADDSAYGNFHCNELTTDGAVGLGTSPVGTVQATIQDALANTLVFVNNAFNTGGGSGTGGNATLILRSTTTVPFSWRLTAMGARNELSVQSETTATMAIFTSSTNLIINTVSTVEPTGLMRGIVIGDGVAATANPTTAISMWSLAGEWQYRTSGASEGAGQTNRVHNRSSTVTGSGTNYTLTNATARIDFGTTDAEIVLPTAGTYLLIATVQFVAGATAGDDYRAKFRNSTDATDVGPEQQTTISTAAGKGIIDLQQTVTITITKTIQLFGFNATAARGTVTSTLTSISYVRLS